MPFVFVVSYVDLRLTICLDMYNLFHLCDLVDLLIHLMNQLKYEWLL